MKKIMFALVAVSIAFYACKKDDKGSGTTPVVIKPISTDSVQMLSDSLTVLNLKTTTKDSLPLPGSTVVLNQSTDTVFAINGGFVIIRPDVEEGAPQGYYVKVKGANTYFTIDLPIAPPPPRQSASKKLSIISRLQSGSDSVIALKLPLNLSSGVFTVQYEAYDANKNVSNVVTAIVKVLANDATTADYKALIGTWTAKLQYQQVNGVYQDTLVLGTDSTFANYQCVDNVLQQDENGTPRLQSVNTISEIFMFNALNRFGVSAASSSKELNVNNSHCDSLAYDLNEGFGIDAIGGFYYNPTTKTVTLILDNNGIASNSFSMTSFQVSSLSTDKMVLVSTYDNNNSSYLIFTK